MKTAAVPLHDRLVASLRALGAIDEPKVLTTKWTVLRLDVMFERATGETTITTKPYDCPRFWLVGRSGALRTVFWRPVVYQALIVPDQVKRHLLATAPSDVPRLARPGNRRRG